MSEWTERNTAFSKALTDVQIAYVNAEIAARDLQAENAKLRELVEDMLSCIEIRAAFGRPPTTDMYEQFAKCASKLGVEVDE